MRVDQRTVTGGVAYQVQANSGQRCFRVVNDSPFILDITWGPGGPVSETVAPHSVEDGLVPEQLQMTSGNARWSGLISLTPVIPAGGTLPNNSPAQQVTIDGYEQVRDRRGYGLSRLQNVGNASGQAAAVANMLQNDANNAGTTIIEATVAGASGSNVFADNQGNFTLREWTGGVLTTIAQTIAGASAGADVVKLGKAGNYFAHVLGKLKVDGASSLDGALLTTDGAGNLSLVSITASGTITGGKLSSDGGKITTDGSGTLQTTVALATTTTEGGAHVWKLFTRTAGIGNDNSFSIFDATSSVTALTLDTSGNGTVNGTLQTGNGAYFPKLLTNGGGASGQAIWVGTTDPGASAAEGDVWIKA